MVALRELDERIAGAEVVWVWIGIRPGMDEAKLHLVLALQLA